MKHIIKEGKAKILASTGKITAKMDVFYNPIMKLNRDISILLLNSTKKKNLRIADPLAASGVRSIRFLLETKKVGSVAINDNSEKAVNAIIQNLKLSNIDLNKVEVYNKDANLFLLETIGNFDYIDIDPFGSPNYFLDAAVKKIARDGVLAITATDTSALAGSFPYACKRKYWAKPLRNEEMHEIGLRIIIRKIQLIAGQYEKALIPVFSFSMEHYYRIFFKCIKGKSIVNEVIESHGTYKEAGPMWLGKLWDEKIVYSMHKCFEKNKHDFENKREVEDLLKIIKEECKINTVGFYDTHKLCNENKTSKILKRDLIISTIKSKGYKAARTHLSWTGIRTDAPINKLKQIVIKL